MNTYRAQMGCLVIGVIALAVCFAGAFTNGPQTFQSYLFAFTLWSGISIGSLGLLMLHNVVGGKWGLAIRTPLEAASKNFLVTAALFIPIVVGAKWIYPWAAGRLDHQHLEHIHSFLNLPFFTIRSAAFFALWTFMGVFLSRYPYRAEKRTSRAVTWLRAASAVGLVILVFTSSLAFVDWLMSIEYPWSSSIYPLMILTGDVLTTLAFLIWIAARLYALDVHHPDANEDAFHDLGNLLLTFVMLWAYMSFSQFLLIWSANLSEEIPWYLRRGTTGWQTVAALLAAFQLFVPLLLLFSRSIKHRPSALASVAVLVFVMRIVDVHWIVKPAFGPFAIHLTDLLALIGVGGLWMFGFLKFLRSPDVDALPGEIYG